MSRIIYLILIVVSGSFAFSVLMDLNQRLESEILKSLTMALAVLAIVVSTLWVSRVFQDGKTKSESQRRTSN